MPTKQELELELKNNIDEGVFIISDYKQNERKSIWLEIDEKYCLSVTVYHYGFTEDEYCYETLLIKDNKIDYREDFGYEDVKRFRNFRELFIEFLSILMTLFYEDNEDNEDDENQDEEYKKYFPEEIPDFETDPDVECGICYQNIKTGETLCCIQTICFNCYYEIKIGQDKCPFCRKENFYFEDIPSFVI